MFQVLPANVNERKVLDTKKDLLIEKGVRCIIADKGYIDKKRQVAFAKDDVLLLTPETALAEVNALLGQTRCIPQDRLLHGRQREKLRLNPSLIC
jgi:hypothetical protein